MQVPALISLEAKQRTPCFDKECGTTENNKDKHDQIEVIYIFTTLTLPFLLGTNNHFNADGQGQTIREDKVHFPQ